MKSHYFFICSFALLLISSLKVLGQVRDDLKITNIISDNITNTYQKPKSQKLILFSLYLYVNKNGILDSTGFSPLAGEPSLNQFLDRKKLSEEFSKAKDLFIGSKNSVIVLPYLLWYLDDLSAKHMWELREDFINLFPDPENVKGRKVILNKPHYIAFGIPEIN